MFKFTCKSFGPVLVGLWLTCTAIPIHAQVGEPANDPESYTPRRTPVRTGRVARKTAAPAESFASGDIHLGIGDVIEVAVLGVPELGKTVEVSSSGNITLPYLDKVYVAGLTVFELEKKLAALYDEDIVNNPQVSVLIREYQSQSITIIGEVARPGAYPLRNKISLISALALAGWITSHAGGKIIVHRAAPASPTGKEGAPAADQATGTLEIDFKELVKAGNEKSNILLNNGDVINVPKEEERFVYVLGGVNHPGAIHANKPLRLLEAAAYAGGLAPLAKVNSILIVHINKQGEREEITTNLDDVIKGKKENLLLQENDVVFVPSKGTKNAREELLNGVLTYTPISFLQSLAFSLIRR